MRAENAALAAATEAGLKPYADIRHAVAAVELPWWSFGVVGLGI